MERAARILVPSRIALPTSFRPVLQTVILLFNFTWAHLRTLKDKAKERLTLSKLRGEEIGERGSVKYEAISGDR